MLKTIYGYPISKNLYIKLYLDTYTKRGLGEGAELNYDIAGKIKGSIYTYYVKEYTTGNERWNITASHWQKLGYKWSVQGQVNFLSDSTFNNNYYQENWARVNRELKSNVSFNRAGVRSNLRITSERLDSYDYINNNFYLSSLVLPRVEYLLFPKKGILGTYSNFNASVQNKYQYENGFYFTQARFDYNLSKNINFGRKVVVTPTIGLREAWQSRTSTVSNDEIFVSSMTPASDNVYMFRYYSSLNLRMRPARWMDLNLVQNYVLRTKLNSMEPDVYSDDYGEEVNNVSFNDVIYLSRKLILRNYLGYSFLNRRSGNPADWKLRFTPIQNELIWQPAFMYTLYLKEQSNFEPHFLMTAQGLMMYGEPTKTNASVGVFYNYFAPKNLDFTTGFDFWATKKWKIGYTLFTSAIDSFRHFLTNNQEIRIYRDLHCWELKLTYNKRLLIENAKERNFEEVRLLFNIKSSATGSFYNKEHEKEFYPFRR